GKGSHGGGLPAGVDRHPEENLKNNVGPSVLRVGEGIKALRSHGGIHGVTHVPPSGHLNRINRNQDRAETQRNELKEVGGDDGNHATQNRVHKLQKKDSGHGGLQMTQGDAGNDGQKGSFNFKKHSHVQDATRRHQDSGEHAEILAVFHLKEFRNGHQAQGAQPADDESRLADENHHRAGNQAIDEGREAGLVTQLRIVHKGDGADFRRGQRRHSDESSQLAARHQKIGEPGDVPLSIEARGHRARQVNNDDDPVHKMKVHETSHANFASNFLTVGMTSSASGCRSTKGKPSATHFFSMASYCRSSSAAS